MTSVAQKTSGSSEVPSPDVQAAAVSGDNDSSSSSKCVNFGARKVVVDGDSAGEESVDDQIPNTTTSNATSSASGKRSPGLNSNGGSNSRVVFRAQPRTEVAEQEEHDDLGSRVETPGGDRKKIRKSNSTTPHSNCNSSANTSTIQRSSSSTNGHEVPNSGDRTSTFNGNSTLNSISTRDSNRGSPEADSETFGRYLTSVSRNISSVSAVIVGKNGKNVNDQSDPNDQTRTGGGKGGEGDGNGSGSNNCNANVTNDDDNVNKSDDHLDQAPASGTSEGQEEQSSLQRSNSNSDSDSHHPSRTNSQTENSAAPGIQPVLQNPQPTSWSINPSISIPISVPISAISVPMSVPISEAKYNSMSSMNTSGINSSLISIHPSANTSAIITRRGTLEGANDNVNVNADVERMTGGAGDPAKNGLFPEEIKVGDQNENQRQNQNQDQTDANSSASKNNFFFSNNENNSESINPLKGWVTEVVDNQGESTVEVQEVPQSGQQDDMNRDNLNHNSQTETEDNLASQPSSTATFTSTDTKHDVYAEPSPLPRKSTAASSTSPSFSPADSFGSPSFSPTDFLEHNDNRFANNINGAVNHNESDNNTQNQVQNQVQRRSTAPKHFQGVLHWNKYGLDHGRHSSDNYGSNHISDITTSGTPNQNQVASNSNVGKVPCSSIAMKTVFKNQMRGHEKKQTDGDDGLSADGVDSSNEESGNSAGDANGTGSNNDANGVAGRNSSNTMSMSGRKKPANNSRPRVNAPPLDAAPEGVGEASFSESANPPSSSIPFSFGSANVTIPNFFAPVPSFASAATNNTTSSAAATSVPVSVKPMPMNRLGTFNTAGGGNVNALGNGANAVISPNPNTISPYPTSSTSSSLNPAAHTGIISPSFGPGGGVGGLNFAGGVASSNSRKNSLAANSNANAAKPTKQFVRIPSPHSSIKPANSGSGSMKKEFAQNIQNSKHSNAGGADTALRNSLSSANFYKTAFPQGGNGVVGDARRRNLEERMKEKDASQMKRQILGGLDGVIPQMRNQLSAGEGNQISVAEGGSKNRDEDDANSMNANGGERGGKDDKENNAPADSSCGSGPTEAVRKDEVFPNDQAAPDQATEAPATSSIENPPMVVPHHAFPLTIAGIHNPAQTSTTLPRFKNPPINFATLRASGNNSVTFGMASTSRSISKSISKTVSSSVDDNSNNIELEVPISESQSPSDEDEESKESCSKESSSKGTASKESTVRSVAAPPPAASTTGAYTLRGVNGNAFGLSGGASGRFGNRLIVQNTGSAVQPPVFKRAMSASVFARPNTDSNADLNNAQSGGQSKVVEIKQAQLAVVEPKLLGKSLSSSGTPILETALPLKTVTGQSQKVSSSPLQSASFTGEGAGLPVFEKRMRKQVLGKDKEKRKENHTISNTILEQVEKLNKVENINKHSAKVNALTGKTIGNHNANSNLLSPTTGSLNHNANRLATQNKIGLNTRSGRGNGTGNTIKEGAHRVAAFSRSHGYGARAHSVGPIRRVADLYGELMDGHEIGTIGVAKKGNNREFGDEKKGVDQVHQEARRTQGSEDKQEEREVDQLKTENCPLGVVENNIKSTRERVTANDSSDCAVEKPRKKTSPKVESAPTLFNLVHSPKSEEKPTEKRPEKRRSVSKEKPLAQTSSKDRFSLEGTKKMGDVNSKEGSNINNQKTNLNANNSTSESPNLNNNTDSTTTRKNKWLEEQNWDSVSQLSLCRQGMNLFARRSQSVFNRSSAAQYDLLQPLGSIRSPSSHRSAMASPAETAREVKQGATAMASPLERAREIVEEMTKTQSGGGEGNTDGDVDVVKNESDDINGVKTQSDDITKNSLPAPAVATNKPQVPQRETVTTTLPHSLAFGVPLRYGSHAPPSAASRNSHNSRGLLTITGAATQRANSANSRAPGFMSRPLGSAATARSTSASARTTENLNSAPVSSSAVRAGSLTRLSYNDPAATRFTVGTVGTVGGRQIEFFGNHTPHTPQINSLRLNTGSLGSAKPIGASTGGVAFGSRIAGTGVASSIAAAQKSEGNSETSKEMEKTDGNEREKTEAAQSKESETANASTNTTKRTNSKPAPRPKRASQNAGKKAPIKSAVQNGPPQSAKLSPQAASLGILANALSQGDLHRRSPANQNVGESLSVGVSSSSPSGDVPGHDNDPIADTNRVSPTYGMNNLARTPNRTSGLNNLTRTPGQVSAMMLNQNNNVLRPGMPMGQNQIHQNQNVTTTTDSNETANNNNNHASNTDHTALLHSIMKTPSQAPSMLKTPTQNNPGRFKTPTQNSGNAMNGRKPTGGRLQMPSGGDGVSMSRAGSPAADGDHIKTSGVSRKTSPRVSERNCRGSPRSCGARNSNAYSNDRSSPLLSKFSRSKSPTSSASDSVSKESRTTATLPGGCRDMVAAREIARSKSPMGVIDRNSNSNWNEKSANGSANDNNGRSSTSALRGGTEGRSSAKVGRARSRENVGAASNSSNRKRERNDSSSSGSSGTKNANNNLNIPPGRISQLSNSSSNPGGRTVFCVSRENLDLKDDEKEQAEIARRERIQAKSKKLHVKNKKRDGEAGGNGTMANNNLESNSANDIASAEIDVGVNGGSSADNDNEVNLVEPSPIEAIQGSLLTPGLRTLPQVEVATTTNPDQIPNQINEVEPSVVQAPVVQQGFSSVNSSSIVAALPGSVSAQLPHRDISIPIQDISVYSSQPSTTSQQHRHIISREPSGIANGITLGNHFQFRNQIQLPGNLYPPPAASRMLNQNMNIQNINNRPNGNLSQNLSAGNFNATQASFNDASVSSSINASNVNNSAIFTENTPTDSEFQNLTNSSNSQNLTNSSNSSSSSGGLTGSGGSGGSGNTQSSGGTSTTTLNFGTSLNNNLLFSTGVGGESRFSQPIQGIDGTMSGTVATISPPGVYTNSAMPTPNTLIPASTISPYNNLNALPGMGSNGGTPVNQNQNSTPTTAVNGGAGVSGVTVANSNQNINNVNQNNASQTPQNHATHQKNQNVIPPRISITSCPSVPFFGKPGATSVGGVPQASKPMIPSLFPNQNTNSGSNSLASFPGSAQITPTNKFTPTNSGNSAPVSSTQSSNGANPISGAPAFFTVPNNTPTNLLAANNANGAAGANTNRLAFPRFDVLGRGQNGTSNGNGPGDASGNAPVVNIEASSGVATFGKRNSVNDSVTRVSAGVAPAGSPSGFFQATNSQTSQPSVGIQKTESYGSRNSFSVQSFPESKKDEANAEKNTNQHATVNANQGNANQIQRTTNQRTTNGKHLQTQQQRSANQSQSEQGVQQQVQQHQVQPGGDNQDVDPESSAEVSPESSPLSSSSPAAGIDQSGGSSGTDRSSSNTESSNTDTSSDGTYPSDQTTSSSEQASSLGCSPPAGFERDWIGTEDKEFRLSRVGDSGRSGRSRTQYEKESENEDNNMNNLDDKNDFNNPGDDINTFNLCDDVHNDYPDPLGDQGYDARRSEIDMQTPNDRRSGRTEEDSAFKNQMMGEDVECFDSPDTLLARSAVVRQKLERALKTNEIKLTTMAEKEEQAAKLLKHAERALSGFTQEMQHSYRPTAEKKLKQEEKFAVLLRAKEDAAAAVEGVKEERSNLVNKIAALKKRMTAHKSETARTLEKVKRQRGYQNSLATATCIVGSQASNGFLANSVGSSAKRGAGFSSTGKKSHNANSNQRLSRPSEKQIFDRALLQECRASGGKNIHSTRNSGKNSTRNLSNTSGGAFFAASHAKAVANANPNANLNNHTRYSAKKGNSTRSSHVKSGHGNPGDQLDTLFGDSSTYSEHAANSTASLRTESSLYSSDGRGGRSHDVKAKSCARKLIGPDQSSDVGSSTSVGRSSGLKVGGAKPTGNPGIKSNTSNPKRNSQSKNPLPTGKSQIQTKTANSNRSRANSNNQIDATTTAANNNAEKSLKSLQRISRAKDILANALSGRPDNMNGAKQTLKKKRISEKSLTSVASASDASLPRENSKNNSKTGARPGPLPKSKLKQDFSTTTAKIQTRSSATNAKQSNLPPYNPSGRSQNVNLNNNPKSASVNFPKSSPLADEPEFGGILDTCHNNHRNQSKNSDHDCSHSSSMLDEFADMSPNSLQDAMQQQIKEMELLRESVDSCRDDSCRDHDGSCRDNGEGDV